MKNQTTLQELQLRSDLFDKRYAIYQKIKDFISIIHPGNTCPSQDQEKEFDLLIQEANFFFRRNGNQRDEQNSR